MKLSAILIIKNESHNLKECLKSLEFADEWVVVDSGSTDDSVVIARDFGAKVIETADWPGFGPQKNRALDACTGEWVLSIDADERISDDLQSEIKEAIKNSSCDAWELPRLSSFCGRAVRYCGWYPDYSIRLFRRSCGRFSNSLVHEKFQVRKGQVGKLRNPIIHYSYRTDSDFLHKLEHYSSLGAEQARVSGKKSSLGKALLHGFAAFVRAYIFRLGFLDGSTGVIVSIMAAEYSYHKYLKLMLMESSNRMMHNPNTSAQR